MATCGSAAPRTLLEPTHSPLSVGGALALGGFPQQDSPLPAHFPLRLQLPLFAFSLARGVTTDAIQLREWQSPLPPPQQAPGTCARTHCLQSVDQSTCGRCLVRRLCVCVRSYTVCSRTCPWRWVAAVQRLSETPPRRASPARRGLQRCVCPAQLLSPGLCLTHPRL